MNNDIVDALEEARTVMRELAGFLRMVTKTVPEGDTRVLINLADQLERFSASANYDHAPPHNHLNSVNPDPDCNG